MIVRVKLLACVGMHRSAGYSSIPSRKRSTGDNKTAQSAMLAATQSRPRPSSRQSIQKAVSSSENCVVKRASLLPLLTR
jgi:hypothetical protein